MPFLIDGHNLIPALGLRLSDPQDEAKLTTLLTRFFARTGRTGTVYFDRRASGGTPGASSRHLSVRFVAPPRTADDAILAHLARLRGDSRNWTVVTSDQSLGRAAGRAGARWVSTAAFAIELQNALASSGEEKPEASLSPDELAAFEKLFRDREPPQ
jgi:uncharacterized protein